VGNAACRIRACGQNLPSKPRRSSAKSREAKGPPHLADLLARFTEIRRAALLAILRRGQERGELAPDADLSLIVDQAYGLFWYRLSSATLP
jgi:hypothetical protein